ncbi:hypothetical protein DKX38_016725 [Salix brachista]|uniref:Uncharacterized protein n=1 Tax=Salix brachista TaxID=2182728 RepID=A0A5N5L964_9ROSI|nr:hypothetical protein DKX38_016725 [Salix brachista]
MDVSCKKSQSTTNLRKMVHIATRPKKILQLWLWWAPQQLRLKTAAPHVINNGSKARRSLEYYRENYKESLLVGSKFRTRGNKPAAGGVSSGTEKVPKGFLAVYVGAEQRRFVIPLRCLSTPGFMGLMDKVAEEFGYDHQEGGLRIPCEEEDFEEILVGLREDRMASKSNT